MRTGGRDGGRGQLAVRVRVLRRPTCDPNAGPGDRRAGDRFGVRDLADLRQMGIPVFPMHLSAQGTVKETLGDVNVPVVCGGQVINPVI